MPLSAFHPAVAAWFTETFAAPTPAQARAWPALKGGRHALIAAPTGSGKTLAAFLAAIDDLVHQGVARGGLPDATQILYVSPLKALSNDIEQNLGAPLAGIAERLAELGLPTLDIRAEVRTGDTPQADRQRMLRRPPQILVTTPESLYLLLTSKNGRELLGTVRTAIVDEIHAMVGDKRGAHLALSLERLEAVAGRRLTRIGLSATQKPIGEVARFLVGGGGLDAAGAPDCEIVDTGHRRELDLAIEIPPSPLGAIMSMEVWDEVYERVVEWIESHSSTLIFVNTRRHAERIAHALSERLGEDAVTAHHGSMSRGKRLDAEQRLKAGELRALVATASLELGIDVGAIDLVIQLGTPKWIATVLQRVGRAGHSVGGVPKGRLFPLSRDELVEAAAVLDAVRRGELDTLEIPVAPLDVLAQQIVAEAAAADWDVGELYAACRRAHPFRDLSRERFDEILDMLAQGFTTRRGRRGAHIHLDGVNGRIKGRRGARLTALTNGGAIPDNFDLDVILEPQGIRIGSVNEDFAVESLAGDIFQLGNASWRVQGLRDGRLHVEDAGGLPPSMPFWFGEAPARSNELCHAVSRLRAEIGGRLGDPTTEGEAALEPAIDWLANDVGLERAAARQITAYLAAGQGALGALPTLDTVILERFFDEAGDMHVVLHSPFGARVNRAWGLALRKRFCKQFNFELQAAATEDAIVLSLGTTHSFPLAEVFQYLSPASVREVLVQAMLDSPIFEVRWRWNATRALAIRRNNKGKRVPPQLQRMAAEDLLTLVFPDQVACFENIDGERRVPDHPLVQQTIHDCLTEAMDIDRLEAVLAAMQAGEIRTVARDLREPSPLAQEILNARPYAFLDDAPAEERRTLAIQQRRWLDPAEAAELAQLDGAAIERVRAEAWPDPRDPDELHDALILHGYLTAAEGQAGGWGAHLAALQQDRRAAVATAVPATGGEPVRLWVAAERLPEVLAVHPGAELDPPEVSAPRRWQRPWSAAAALIELVRGRLEGVGPVTAAELAVSAGVDEAAVRQALTALEGEGFVFQGQFTPGGPEVEWCERRLLARIHRYTLKRLRAEIEPVQPAVFQRFQLHWQHAVAETRLKGPEAVRAVVGQLNGYAAPAAAWERELLPLRVDDYDPAWLDAVCMSGEAVWGRLLAPNGERAAPVKTTPITLVNRLELPLWQALLGRRGAGAADHGNGRGRDRRTGEGGEADGTGSEPDRGPAVSPEAARVLAHLDRAGASFFADIAGGAVLLPTQVERALAELVAGGWVTADSFTGLRALLTPSDRRPGTGRGRGRRRRAHFGMAEAGRWTRLGGAGPVPPAGGEFAEEALELIAETLLERYGVVFRRLLEREAWTPPWRDLVRVYRRWEARGQLRGGRFVAGASGEQFALPEAVPVLRKLRKSAGDGRLVALNATDPANLTGLLTGDRVPNLATNRVLLRDGEPVAVLAAGEVRYLVEADVAEQWEVKRALEQTRMPPKLKAYLGRSA